MVKTVRTRKSRILKPLSECRWSKAWRTCWATRWSSSPGRMTRFQFSVFSLYLFCNGLLYNLVKTGQVENVADSTQLVVNFRSLEFKLFQATFRFVSRIPSRSRLAPHRPRVSGWPGDEQIGDKFLQAAVHQRLEHNSKHSSEPKVWDLCRNSFHLERKRLRAYSTISDPFSPWTRRRGCLQRQCPCPWWSPSCWCSGCASWFPWSAVEPVQKLTKSHPFFRCLRCPEQLRHLFSY